MDPVRSRCLCVRVAAPSYEAVQAQLQHVAKKEALTLPPPFAARLAAASQRNLRRALLVMEVARVQQYPFKEDQRVPPLDWEQYVMVREEGKDERAAEIALDRGSQTGGWSVSCMIVVGVTAMQLAVAWTIAMQLAAQPTVPAWNGGLTRGAPHLIHISSVTVLWRHVAQSHPQSPCTKR